MTVQVLERKLKPFQEPVKSAILKWLLLHLPPQPITNKKMHRDYAGAVSTLIRELERGSIRGAERKAVEKYLASTVPFIEEYEKKEFKPKPSTPEGVLRFLMEQNDLNQYDLAEDLGGQPVVSDILRGKRKLTREHIERLSERFHISPSSFYPSPA